MKRTTLLLALLLALLSGCATSKVQHIRVRADQNWHVHGYEKRWDGTRALRINAGDSGPVDIWVWPDGQTLVTESTEPLFHDR